MNKPNTKCRVCRKDYFCCSDSRKIGSWRTMTCSAECFREYMDRIEKARKPIAKELPTIGENSETEKAKTKKKGTSIPDIGSEHIIMEN